MKIYAISYRKIVLAMTTACVVALCGLTAPVEGKSNRGVGATAGVVSSSERPARLIIRRFPTLGNNVIVDVFVDGAPFTSLTYGRTFDGALPAGRHVLSVEATPRPTYVTRTSFTLNAHSGETYTFVADDNNSGNLILR